MLIPLVTALAILAQYAELKEEYASAKSLFSILLIFAVVVMLIKSLGQFAERTGNFFTLSTGRNCILPFLFTVASIPFLYSLYCYVNLETAILRINLKAYPSDELQRYAKRRFSFAFMFRPKKLSRAFVGFHSMTISTKDDVIKIVSAKC